MVFAPNDSNLSRYLVH